MAKQRTGNQSLHIGTFAGIPVKIHWTFGFIVLLVIYMGVKDQLSAVGFAWLGITIFSLFACVVLHEYGHALTARKYGIRTTDILLTPIGGIARLNGMPKKPLHEFYIAIAGPLVNVAIMLITLVYLFFTIDASSQELLEDLIIIDSFKELVLYLFFLNFILFAFNLIPAFPMDGGRILRSLLSLKMSKLKATRIASILGRILAVIFVVVAVIYQQFSLGFIGVFVFIMAQREYKMASVEARFQESSVSDVYRSRYTAFNEFDPIKKPFDLFKEGNEKSFLVLNQLNQVVGVIHELFLENMKGNFDEYESIRSIISSRFEFVDVELPLEQLFKMMQQKGYSILPVRKDGAVVGVVDRKDVMKYLKV